ncbi:hypothetical protein CNBF0540 [Cryptococcus deneoformans B-3501A]|uniref:Uncharacterized protein n=1 Tax=Cryptococcus deneoformans (strain JEC21 / ATCC MYA-565) TaxID=214684 RepID=Q5KET3_CRYD1|nr:hypothetical protein CNF04350 [Cryptococcus neoformans var. neoformans JEC21]XP_774889.1 hypothetical protein CNBF0540 [Cryptococcus neoformans var. neoformans B-3501A]AAW44408.2 hypothetical protein CNF04350 [Cryptococcus neoformans var. neoformans JEC21]EAL20242.1 hypothetical protein CNBF0540 [Cryptococcus neoformans var. neoformans B-3501A]
MLQQASHSSSKSTPSSPRLMSSTPPPYSPQRKARRGSEPSPIMIALSGWPEPVYIASDTSSWDRKKQQSRSGTATPPEIYDGVGGPRIIPQHIPSLLAQKNARLPASQPQNARAPATSAGKADPAKVFPAPVDNDNNTPTNAPNRWSRSNGRNAIKPLTPAYPPAPPAGSIFATPPAAGNSSNSKTPVAPQFSIFATTCPHLTDPSLGPCPFPTHPHDVRSMFPPTSHLAKRGAQMPLSRPSRDKGTTDKITDKQPIRPKYLPPTIFPSVTISSITHSPTTIIRSSSSSSSSTKINDKGKEREDPIKRPSTFADPRYLPSSAILHKGRALPLVPSWSGVSSPSSSRTSTPRGERSRSPAVPTPTFDPPPVTGLAPIKTSTDVRVIDENYDPDGSPTFTTTNESNGKAKGKRRLSILGDVEAGILWKKVVVNDLRQNTSNTPEVGEAMDVDVVEEVEKMEKVVI